VVFEQELVLAGRVLLGGYFAFSGINHFLNTEQLTQWVESKGIPSPRFAVLESGGQLLFGGLGVMFGALPVVSAGALALFVAKASFLMHDFWNMEGEDRHSNKINFTKNIGLIGGLLFFAALAGGHHGLEYSVGVTLSSLL